MVKQIFTITMNRNKIKIWPFLSQIELFKLLKGLCQLVLQSPRLPCRRLTVQFPHLTNIQGLKITEEKSAAFTMTSTNDQPFQSSSESASPVSRGDVKEPMHFSQRVRNVAPAIIKGPTQTRFKLNWASLSKCCKYKYTRANQQF